LNPNVPKKRTGWPVNKKKTAVCRRTKMCPVVNLNLQGQYHDYETGYNYNWHRYFAPNLGTYLVRDPIGLIGGFNPYVYVLSNPINISDPLGLLPGDVYLFTGGGLAPSIAVFSSGPYGHAAIEILDGKVLSSGVDETGKLKVYIRNIYDELSERSFDVFRPVSFVHTSSLTMFAEKMEGKLYITGNVCSDVTAAAIAEANAYTKAYKWDLYWFFVSPNNIASDPYFNKFYRFHKSVKYLKGGYRIVTPSGAYLSGSPY